MEHELKTSEVTPVERVSNCAKGLDQINKDLDNNMMLQQESEAKLEKLAVDRQDMTKAKDDQVKDLMKAVEDLATNNNNA